jgi:hypothetical protein
VAWQRRPNGTVSRGTNFTIQAAQALDVPVFIMPNRRWL